MTPSLPPAEAPDRWLRDTVVRVGATYGAIITLEGETRAQAGDPPCEEERLHSLMLALVEGATLLLGAGPVERASLQLREGSLHVHRVSRETYFCVFSRGNAPLLRQIQLDHAVAQLRAALSERGADAFVRLPP